MDPEARLYSTEGRATPALRVTVARRTRAAYTYTVIMTAFISRFPVRMALQTGLEYLYAGIQVKQVHRLQLSALSTLSADLSGPRLRSRASVPRTLALAKHCRTLDDAGLCAAAFSF